MSLHPDPTVTSPAAEALDGLLQAQAALSPKYFYDAQGSRLFAAITELEEYYPTRTEAQVFATHGAAIAQVARGCTGPAPVLVDLGAGDCAKGAALFPLLEPRRYVAVDISADFLGESLAQLRRQHPAIDMRAVGQDFSQELRLDPALTGPAPLVFYPGSSIGNFDPPAALALLRQCHAVAGRGALLIGVDLVKDVAVLEAAYDDALGLTAAFNLNLLRHLNRRFGSDFDLRQWRHHAGFNAGASRIEMHLESLIDQVVRWPGGERVFATGERIHTENSYKWSAENFAVLLREAGFRDTRHWTDPRGWFAVFCAQA